ncbi:MAG TPA: histidine phosphatase family protein [Acidobacteriaceae bacterium]|nr:histidine phosphatase family protein [Acidobacteriaceae bacterium]
MTINSRAELWLIRHGETEWSASGKHTSRTDVRLTEKGRERAAVLGEYLAETEFCAVFRSPMARARETCEIAGFGERAVVDADLCEWNYGVYEGQTTREIQAELPGWSVWKDAIVGGESLEEVGARADRMIAKALGAAKTAGAGARNVALFGHAHILRILAARWVGLPPDCGALLVLGTGSVSVLGWERETRVIQQWNRGFEDNRNQ